MRNILIIFHSQTGMTEKLANAVAQGVDETGHAKAVLKRAGAADADDVKKCAALVVCSPEYFGYMAGSVKDFFDRTYEELKDDPAANKKPFSVVISAGNDGSGALSHIERICRGYRFKKIQQPIVSRGSVTDEKLSECRLLGSTIAEGLAAGIF